MKYKLIKTYPGSPKLGTILEKLNNYISNCNYYSINPIYIENQYEFWQKVVEKDYEILKEKASVNIGSNKIEIISVKRLSDGEVFAIGDNIEIRNLSSKIDSFYIKNDNLMITSELSNCGDYLKNIIKRKKPLFTTEDGVDIFDNETIHFVRLDDFKIVTISVNLHTKIGSFSKIFSTKEKAEEYIVMNKPVLSLQEIITLKNGKSTGRISPLYLQKLKELVKQKLNK